MATKICANPACGGRTNIGHYCQACHKARRQRTEAGRQSSAARGYDARWQRARQVYLAEHPYCVHCKQQGRVAAATDVDHITPHRGDRELFWDVTNWQSLCKACHSRKSGKGQ